MSVVIGRLGVYINLENAHSTVVGRLSRAQTYECTYKHAGRRTQNLTKRPSERRSVTAIA